LRAAHLDVEALTMDREVLRIRDTLSQKYAELVYNGYWFSPEMEFLQVHLCLMRFHVAHDIQQALMITLPQTNMWTGFCFFGASLSTSVPLPQNALDFTQKCVNGEVRMRLFRYDDAMQVLLAPATSEAGSLTFLVYFCRGQPMILGRSSPQSLYKQDLVSMDVEGGFDVALSEGFIRTNVRSISCIMASTLTSTWTLVLFCHGYPGKSATLY
jgi:argininosuccinate synthase